MATLKQRLRRKNASGTYDTVHLETESGMILRPSGRTVEADLAAYLPEYQDSDDVPKSLTDGKIILGKTKAWFDGSSVREFSMSDHTHSGYATSTHYHSASQITSGTLPVARGGTGVTSIDALKSALGMTTGASSQYEIYPVGNLIKFDNKIWICVHYDNNTKYLYLGARDIISLTTFGDNNVYNGSTLARVAKNYQNNNMSSSALSYCANITVNGVTAKVFVPSYEQVNGGFSYFNGNSTRIAYYNGSANNWWTSSPYVSSRAYYVCSDGGIDSYHGVGSSYGFRPFVALAL